MQKLSNYQLILIGSNVFTSALIISLPAQIIRIARQDAWMSYIPALLLMILPIWLLSTAMRRFPDCDLFHALEWRYPLAGRVISIFYLLFFFYILIRDFRMLIDFINLSLLPRTPLAVIAALVILTCILIARGGAQVIARMHELFYPIIPIIAIILPFLFYSGGDFRFFKPFLGHGVEPVLHGSWYALSYIGEITVLPFIAANRTFQFRIGFISLLIGTFLLEVLILLLIFVVGTNISGRIMYPTYELVREVRITEFLDRFDAILVTFWLPTLFLKISLMLSVICHGVKQVIPHVQEKILPTSIGVFALVCTFWFFGNPMQLLNINRGWTSVAVIFEFMLPISLYFILQPKKG